jgi:hypothetical protein
MRLVVAAKRRRTLAWLALRIRDEIALLKGTEGTHREMIGNIKVILQDAGVRPNKPVGAGNAALSRAARAVEIAT